MGLISGVALDGSEKMEVYITVTGGIPQKLDYFSLVDCQGLLDNHHL